jgi:hypothetical protein
MARKHSKSFQSGEEIEPLDAATSDVGMAGDAGDAAADTGEEPAAG